ncbi:MAG: ATP-dependent zinc metalloprotease FtsH [Vulcanimicrobiota bacterium]
MYLVVIVILFTIAMNYNKISSPVDKLDFTDFKKKVEMGKIKELVFMDDRTIKGVLNQGTKNEKQFTTTIPKGVEESLVNYLEEHNVKISAKPPSETPWWFVIVNILPYILLIGFFVLLFRQAQSAGGSQAFNFGRSKAKQLTNVKGKVTFDDVAGVEEAKEELKEVVDFLRAPAKYKALGARIPKGVLLLGAPGTGKTLLGRAIAGEAGVPFYYISGSDFVEMFVGVGASRVRDLFENAKKTAPCIVFVDEIDAVGRQRGAGLGGGHDEREQTLNQLLVEMDGFENNNGVIVLAATNRPDVLDPALLRPGRFDRHVVVDKPDVKGREAILKVHSRGKPLSADVDLELLGKRTPGFSGADLENLLNEAALLAARLNKDKIEMEDCEEAIDRVLMGPERKSRIISEKEKKITAYHEAGHALVAKMLPDAHPVRKVTILPRGMALGVTWTMPDEDKYTKTKKELLAEITTMMGGRCAEKIVFNEITTGASNDLKKASQVSRQMITKFGMSDDLGPITFGHQRDQVFLGRDIMEERNYGDSIANKIDKEVKEIAEGCYQHAKKILLENRELLDKLAEMLLDKEVVEEQELNELVKKKANPVDGISIEKEEETAEEKQKVDDIGVIPPLKPLGGPDFAFE